MSAEVKQRLDDLMRSRAEFYALFDAHSKRLDGTDVFDFSSAEPLNFKDVYSKFYDYDYKIRRLLQDLYKAYDLK